MPDGLSRVSIVIPTLNEASCLGRTLRCLTCLEPSAWEVIVVDGGSRDGTVAIAQSMPHTRVICTTEAGRSRQMNAGAAAATGDILCFLHADTLVPDDAVAIMATTLTDATITCGGFISLMAGPMQVRWGLSLLNYIKTYCAPLVFYPGLFFKGLRLLFGDQVMFCRTSDFWDCGGFDPARPIMEDADLCLRLVRHGRIHLVNRVVYSSDRRVVKLGLLKALFLYFYIGILWGVGVSTTYLKRFYAEIR